MNYQRMIRLVLVTLVASVALLLHFCFTSPISPGSNDWQSFVASGRAARDGLNPYAVYPLTHRAEHAGRSFPAPNLNPPALLPVFDLFGRVPISTSFRVWQLASLVIYVGATIALVRTYGHISPFRLLWLVSFTPLWSTLSYGQVYALLLYLAATALLCIRRGKYCWAGLMIGVLVAIKPNFLVWPALLLIAGSYEVVACCAFAFFVVQLPSLALYGTGVFAQWVEVIRVTETAVVHANFSFWGLATRLGVPNLGLVATVVLLGFVAFWTYRRRLDPLTISMLSLPVALLASPIAWPGYALVLIPNLLSEGREPPSAWLLCIPQVFAYLWGGPAAFAYCGSCILLAWRALQYNL